MSVTVDIEAAVSARLFRVLGDPTRVALLRRLAVGPGTVGELVEAVGSASRSRVSNHLACLAWCGLVSAEKIGRSVEYRLTDPQVLRLLDAGATLARPRADQLASCTRIGPDWL